MEDPDKKVRRIRPANMDNLVTKSASTAAWIFGLLILLFLMAIVVFVKIEPDKQPIIRFLMALSAGFCATFFLGQVVLHGKLGAMQISAAGGVALFILIQFVFDPFRVLPTPSPSPQSVMTQTPMESATPGATPIVQPSTAPKLIATPLSVIASTQSPSALDIAEILRAGDAWTQSGNPRDQQKALDLYRNAIPNIRCARLPRDILNQAEDAYAKHDYDAAVRKYRAVLQVCQEPK